MKSSLCVISDPQLCSVMSSELYHLFSSSAVPNIVSYMSMCHGLDVMGNPDSDRTTGLPRTCPTTTIAHSPGLESFFRMLRRLCSRARQLGTPSLVKTGAGYPSRALPNPQWAWPLLCRNATCLVGYTLRSTWPRRHTCCIRRVPVRLACGNQGDVRRSQGCI